MKITKLLVPVWVLLAASAFAAPGPRELERLVAERDYAAVQRLLSAEPSLLDPAPPTHDKYGFEIFGASAFSRFIERTLEQGQIDEKMYALLLAHQPNLRARMAGCPNNASVPWCLAAQAERISDELLAALFRGLIANDYQNFAAKLERGGEDLLRFFVHKPRTLEVFLAAGAPVSEAAFADVAFDLLGAALRGVQEAQDASALRELLRSDANYHAAAKRALKTTRRLFEANPAAQNLRALKAVLRKLGDEESLDELAKQTGGLHSQSN